MLKIIGNDNGREKLVAEANPFDPGGLSNVFNFFLRSGLKTFNIPTMVFVKEGGIHGFILISLLLGGCVKVQFELHPVGSVLIQAL